MGEKNRQRQRRRSRKEQKSKGANEKILLKRREIMKLNDKREGTNKLLLPLNLTM